MNVAGKISYEEGLQDGLHQAEHAITKEKERADKLLIALILSYHAQDKSPAEIAALCEQNTDFVLDILKKIIYNHAKSRIIIVS